MLATVLQQQSYTKYTTQHTTALTYLKSILIEHLQIFNCLNFTDKYLITIYTVVCVKKNTLYITA